VFGKEYDVWNDWKEIEGKFLSGSSPHARILAELGIEFPYPFPE
jgi:hypothetical protein